MDVWGQVFRKSLRSSRSWVLEILLVFIAAAAFSSQASALSLQPIPMYMSATLNSVDQGYCFPCFDTPGAAFEAFQSYIVTVTDPGDGLAHWRALSYRANPVASFANKRIAAYEIEMEVLHHGIWEWGGWRPDIGIHLECPIGFPLRMVSVSGKYITYDCYGPPLFESCCDIGNPISAANGIKRQTEVDFQSPNAGGLQFARTYRSDRNGWAHNFQYIGADLGDTSRPITPQRDPWPDAGCYWGIGAHTGKPYCFQRMPSGSVNDFIVQRGNDRMLEFGNASNLNPGADINDRVSPIFDGNGTKVAYQVYNADNDAIEKYDLTGRLQTIVGRNGAAQTFSYSDSNTPPATASKEGLLIRITDQFNRQLNFTYDSFGRMTTMVDPSGNEYRYAYDEASSYVRSGKQPGGNLTSITYPDNKKRIYWYNEPDKTAGANLPNALTGITDENGARFATFTYDSFGKAMSTEHAGGVNKFSITIYPSYSSTVTDPLGKVRTYSFTNILGVLKYTSQSQPAGAGSAAASRTRTYDANGNLASSTDYNGNKTTYTYDLSRNLETKRIEAFGTAKARTISTTWHANYRLPLTIAEPNKFTTFTYDASGNLLTKSEQATTDANGSQGLAATPVGNPRVWNYTYNGLGQVLTTTAPNGAVNTNTYDAMGNLASVTNALGHVATFSNYDTNGRVGTITDPNGLVTTLTYSPRGWLTSKSVGGEVTVYTYDGVGQLIALTQPDGSTINYTYDDAHRLTAVADSLGNSIHYTLDLIGNRIQEQVKDPSGTLARQTGRAYDALNRLQQITGGMQ